MLPRRRFHRTVFFIAGLYNIGWGLYSVYDPQWLFRFSGLPLLNHPQVFACLAMVVGLYGIVYFEVARAPERGWILAAVGISRKGSWSNRVGEAHLGRHLAGVNNRSMPFERFHLVDSVLALSFRCMAEFQKRLIDMTATKLSKSMTVGQFENGYWYATELRRFADSIGIPSANKLRKDELEKAIVTFLKTGKTKLPTRRSLTKTGVKDSEKGLSLELPIVNYTNNKETKTFLEQEARKLVPNLKRKSGARYRLNRWREEQLTRGLKITYKDLVKRYAELNQTEGSFTKIPHPRYINFLAEFLANEKGATREEGIRAWKQLKRMDLPKTYRAWAKCRSK